MEQPPSNVIDFPRPEAEDGEASGGIGIGSTDMDQFRQSYLKARSLGLSADKTLAALEKIASGPLRRVAEIEGWERTWAATGSDPLLSSRAVDLRSRLEDVIEQEGVARGILKQATQVVEGPPPFGHTKQWPDDRAIAEWRSARNDWVRLSREASDLGERLLRLDHEASRSGDWEYAYRERLDQLRAEYSGGGPQYDLLVEALASLDIRVRRMELSDRDVDPSEYRQLSELRLKYVAQIQKHTESLKSESVQPVQNAIAKLMGELEREIKPSNPTAWEEIVRATVRAVEKHGLGLESVA